MAVRISFLNQKGGVGKSTCSILVGAALQSAGYQVQFEDMDPQGSLAMWVSHVGKLAPLPEGVAPDVIICDTPVVSMFQRAARIHFSRSHFPQRSTGYCR